MTVFTAGARPVLIGSLPHKSHQEAVDLIFDYTPADSALAAVAA